MIAAVPSPPGIAVAFEALVPHLCPYADEQDLDTVTISWSTDGCLSFELHDLLRYLAAFASVKISREQLVSTIVADTSTLAASVQLATAQDNAQITMRAG